MFPWKKKEEKQRSSPRAPGGIPQIGLFGTNLDDNLDDMLGDDGDDPEIEAELAALLSGHVPKKTARSADRGAKARQNAAKNDLSAMIAASMNEVPSDDDISGDEDDPSLLAELNSLVSDDEIQDSGNHNRAALASENVPEVPSSSQAVPIVSLLEERVKMYEIAEANAKSAGESSRSRRFGRGLKTLKDLLKQAKGGRPINEDDIPPAVTTGVQKKSPSPSSVTSPVSSQTPSPKPSPTDDAPAVKPPSPAKQNVPTRAPPPVPPRIGIPLPGLVGEKSLPSLQPTNQKPPEPRDGVMVATAQVETPSENSGLVAFLCQRQKEYKLAAVQAKKNGDMNTALRYVKISKQFEQVIAAARSGQPTDLSQMPPPPPGFSSSSEKPPKVEETLMILPTPQKAEEPTKQGNAEPEAEIPMEVPEDFPPPDPSLYGAPPPPTSVMEALEQRLAKYKAVEASAKEEGNNSKVRRTGRIIKQYEGAIKLHKQGKPIPIDELPTPPGFAPIPQETAAPTKEISDNTRKVPQPGGEREPTRAAPPPPHVAQGGTANKPPLEKQKSNVRLAPQSMADKQLSLLSARQTEFKKLALAAKKKGEMNQAREYLRLAKGFDPLIEASKCGLPVDMNTIPVPPSDKVVLESDFDFVSPADCIPGSDSEIYERLEEDLVKQIKMCLANRDHFKSVGDVASANKFEQLAVHSKQDLDSVKAAHRRSDKLPRFHYETRTFSKVQCCTDLSDNDLELTIVQGINYNVSNPTTVDTYVKYEFPFPNENPPKDKTSVIRDTNAPQYNQTFIIPINRSVPRCQRVFKRHAIKLEVWSKGGLFRSDALIGTVAVKLQPLETKCIIHEAFDLMDGRKPVGGKLEVKVRVRNPIAMKQVEQVSEKWLVIDAF